MGGGAGSLGCHEQGLRILVNCAGKSIIADTSQWLSMI